MLPGQSICPLFDCGPGLSQVAPTLLDDSGDGASPRLRLSVFVKWDYGVHLPLSLVEDLWRKPV